MSEQESNLIPMSGWRSRKTQSQTNVDSGLTRVEPAQAPPKRIVTVGMRPWLRLDEVALANGLCRAQLANRLRPVGRELLLCVTPDTLSGVFGKSLRDYVEYTQTPLPEHFADVPVRERQLVRDTQQFEVPDSMYRLLEMTAENTDLPFSTVVDGIAQRAEPVDAQVALDGIGLREHLRPPRAIGHLSLANF
jgi:hypothetical protein